MHIITHSFDHNELLVDQLLSQHPRDMAMYKAIGCNSFEEFQRTGDGQVAVLKHEGLEDGMSLYDLGCGSGRTAQALLRAGWQGAYQGADIVNSVVDYLKEKCPGYEATVNRKLNILAADNSLDMVFHWSVFTHLYVEECYIYLEDIMRALKPGGRLVFSFLELEDANHRQIFTNRVAKFKGPDIWSHVDTFLHRDWIGRWAAELGYTAPKFTGGADSANHPSFWQTLASMSKPMAAPNYSGGGNR
jgi:SAM-dependent methyltransferase